MWTFLVRRIGGGLVTLFVIATIAFFITRMAPGSPFTSERSSNPERRRILEKKYGLDKPVLVQYGKALSGYLRGEFGPMVQSEGRMAEDYIWPSFRVSVQLGAISVMLALLLGVALGVVSAAGKNRWPDHVAMSGAVAGICLPNFLLGPLLVLCFSFGLDWLPPGGWPESWSLAELSKLILPSVTLALVHVAYLSRLTRAGMLEVMNQDFVRTARAKGLPEWKVVLKHGLKNGVTPALSYSGPMVAYLVTGSLVVEKYFSIPGMGKHFLDSVTAREWNVLMGCTLIYGALVIALNAVVDLLYGVLDPRVRAQ
jgi:oligopeptide transport system permease protein